MKFVKKIFLPLAAVLMLASCGQGTNPSSNEDLIEKIREVYDAAVDQGKTDLDFDAWIASIKGADGKDGKDGQDGVTPTVEIINGIWYINGTSTGVSAIGKQGESGKPGKDGDDGKDGVGIANVKLTNTDGNVDTYTITFTNGKTSSFIVKNGKDGADGAAPTVEIVENYWYVNGVSTGVKAIGTDGKDGADGEDGETPVIEIIDGYWAINGVTTEFSALGQKGADGADGATPEIRDGYWWINGKNTGQKATGENGKPGIPGTPGEDGEDGVGIEGITKVGSEGLVDTYKILFTNGDTFTYEVTNGAEGAAGYSPKIEIRDGIWCIDGKSTAVKARGEKGEQGLSDYELFKKYYPHYQGSEKDYIDTISTGGFKELPTVGHIGTWKVDSTGLGRRVCDVCGEIETKHFDLPEYAYYPITPDGVEGVYTVDYGADKQYGFAYDATAKTWTSTNNGRYSTKNTASIKITLTFDTGNEENKEVMYPVTYDYDLSTQGSGYGKFGDTISTGIATGKKAFKSDIYGVASGHAEAAMQTNADYTLSYLADTYAGTTYRNNVIISNFMIAIPVEYFPSLSYKTVTVNYNDGNEQETTVYAKGAVPVIETPEREGYRFDGWYTDEALTEEYVLGNVEEDIAIYAKWTKLAKVTINNYQPGVNATFYTEFGTVADIPTPSGAGTGKCFTGFYFTPYFGMGSDYSVDNFVINEDTVAYGMWVDAPEFVTTYRGCQLYGYAYGYNSDKSLVINEDFGISGVINGELFNYNYDDTENKWVFHYRNSSEEEGVFYYYEDYDLMLVPYATGNGYFNTTSEYINVLSKKRGATTSANYIYNFAAGPDKFARVFNLDGINFYIDEDEFITDVKVVWSNKNVANLTDVYSKKAAGDTLFVYDSEDIIILSLGYDGKNFVELDGLQGTYSETATSKNMIVDGMGKFTFDGRTYDYKLGENEDNFDISAILVKSVISSTKAEGCPKVYSYYGDKYDTFMKYDTSAGVWKCMYHGSYSDSTVKTTTFTNPNLSWSLGVDDFWYAEELEFAYSEITLNQDLWTAAVNQPTVTVTYVTNYDVELPAAEYGIKVARNLPVLEREGYRFDGWYCEAGFVNKFQFTADVDEDVTIYAKWVKTYKLTVDYDDGNDPVVSILDEGTVINMVDPIKEGSEFKGWFTDAEFQNAFVNGTAINADISLFAKFENGKYPNNAANYLDKVTDAETFVDSINYSGSSTLKIKFKDTDISGKTAFPWSTVSYDGSTYMRSTNSKNASSYSVFEFIVKATCKVSFDVVVEGESSYDFLIVCVNGTEVLSCSGKFTSDHFAEKWELVATSGDTITFVYGKDSGGDRGFDAAYVGNFAFEAVPEKTVTIVWGNGFDNQTVSVPAGSAFALPTKDDANGLFLDHFYTSDDDGATEKAVFANNTVIDANVTIYASWSKPVAYKGYYSGFNLCSTSGSSKPSTYYVAEIDGKGKGISGKLKDYDVVSINGSQVTFTSDKKGSLAAATDGTYFLVTHYSGPGSDYVPTDTLFAVNTGSAYDANVTFAYTKSGNVWTVVVTVGEKSYTVLVDTANDTVTVE